MVGIVGNWVKTGRNGIGNEKKLDRNWERWCKNWDVDGSRKKKDILEKQKNINWKKSRMKGCAGVQMWEV